MEQPKKTKSLWRILINALVNSVLVVACLWAALAFWYFTPWPGWLRILALVLWMAGTGVVLIKGWHPQLAIGGSVLLVVLLWMTNHPSMNRTWATDQEQMPVVTFSEQQVTIQNMRHATYRTTEDYDINWVTKTYDLDQITRMDFMIETLTTWGVAHTLMTFGFANGDYVAISVEVRKEVGETYSPLKGIYKQYELMYVIADERDLIGLRANVRKDPVYLYPVKVTPEQTRAMFVSMLKRAHQLGENPEFYNTLNSTCTTNIVRHMEELTQEKLPLDMRVLLPGYSDELVFELDLIDTDLLLEDARKRFLINHRSAFGSADSRAWSQQIRQIAHGKGDFHPQVILPPPQ